MESILKNKKHQMTLAVLMITTYIFLNKGFMCKLVVTLETQTHLFTASGKPFFFFFLLPASPGFGDRS